MKRLLLVIATALSLASCSGDDGKTHIYLQRFFGECGAEYGGSTDVAKAEGECGIMTTLINDLETLDKTYGIESMCVAGGMGMALIVERLN